MLRCASFSLGVGLLMIWASACSSKASAPPESLGGVGGSGGASGSSGASGNGASGGASGSAGAGIVIDAGDSGLDPDAACDSIEERGLSTPLNLYVVMDRSSSMDGPLGTRLWDRAVTGLEGFVDDPASAGISVALNFFPSLTDPNNCDQRVYQEPTVAFGALPGNAAAFKAALAATTPGGFTTPTYPALGGAILKGLELEAQRPTETSAVLLVTDGKPQGPAPSCGGVDPTDTNSISQIAATGKDKDVITFVIGLPGVDQSFADAVAAAGGTERAILVGNSNTAQEFRDALAKVRGSALPCDYQLPPRVVSGEYTPSEVNVEVATPSGGKTTLGRNDDCDSAGWRYDSLSAPTKIELCPAACDAVKRELGASIRILLGCPTDVVQ